MKTDFNRVENIIVVNIFTRTFVKMRNRCMASWQRSINFTNRLTKINTFRFHYFYRFVNHPHGPPQDTTCQGLLYTTMLNLYNYEITGALKSGSQIYNYRS